LKVADTDKTASSQDLFERAGKLLQLVLAALYLAGFMVVALHLAGYGVSSLDVFKIQYLAAWHFCSVTALEFGNHREGSDRIRIGTGDDDGRE
jgi:hypothetical protein